MEKVSKSGVGRLVGLSFERCLHLMDGEYVGGLCDDDTRAEPPAKVRTTSTFSSHERKAEQENLTLSPHSRRVFMIGQKRGRHAEHEAAPASGIRRRVSPSMAAIRTGDIVHGDCDFQGEGGEDDEEGEKAEAGEWEGDDCDVVGEDGKGISEIPPQDVAHLCQCGYREAYHSRSLACLSYAPPLPPWVHPASPWADLLRSWFHIGYVTAQFNVPQQGPQEPPS
eukprot:TRINITY_DN586_c1_g1_i1.p2 TRINITY_DN586_c1_g1~~TRINITY_DN586_c1_g1_i1.p2  ORF type:complete len:224 (+),score=65.59 TRINITY_DN586_c1_g1_i1:47-718(+)